MIKGLVGEFIKEGKKVLLIGLGALALYACGDDSSGPDNSTPGNTEGDSTADTPGNTIEEKLDRSKLIKFLEENGITEAGATEFYKIEEGKILTYKVNGEDCIKFDNLSESEPGVFVCDQDKRVLRKGPGLNETFTESPDETTNVFADLPYNDSNIGLVAFPNRLTDAELKKLIQELVYKPVIGKPLLIFIDGATGNIYTRTDINYGFENRSITFTPSTPFDELNIISSTGEQVGTVPVIFQNGTLRIHDDTNLADLTNDSYSLAKGEDIVGIIHKGLKSDGTYAQPGFGAIVTEDNNYNDETPRTGR